ncbi:hypothetical protein J1614_009536 [Plenodomus biglobosus]|nr:hypothetical protein J1614_009536 [Plenodomus biglobosus]
MVPGAYFPVPYLWLPLMSTPQSALGGMVYGVPCGKVVGGGSVVNAMFFHRSDAELYDTWEELGATGWGWANLIPYFKKPAQEPNNGRAQGVFRLVRSVDAETQTRSSARVNRYDRDAQRPNYHILANTAVSRIIFQDNTAVGVAFVSNNNGTQSEVRARKEVIVAAGSVHTPQILQLSGIGDATHLKSLGIDPVSDLPGVGHNLQDHLVLKVNYNCK